MRKFFFLFWQFVGQKLLKTFENVEWCWPNFLNKEKKKKNCNMLIISLLNSFLIFIICIIYVMKMKIIMNDTLVFLSPLFLGCSQEKLMPYAITYKKFLSLSSLSSVAHQMSHKTSHTVPKRIQKNFQWLSESSDKSWKASNRL